MEQSLFAYSREVCDSFCIPRLPRNNSFNKIQLYSEHKFPWTSFALEITEKGELYTVEFPMAGIDGWVFSSKRLKNFHSYCKPENVLISLQKNIIEVVFNRTQNVCQVWLTIWPHRITYDAFVRLHKRAHFCRFKKKSWILISHGEPLNTYV